MPTPVIIDCCRTPIGRSHAEKGVFRDVRGDDLAVAVVRSLIERTGIDPAEVEDVLLGCTQQSDEQGLNVARTVALMAGLPSTTAGATINRLCGSSLQALNQAAHAISAGAADVLIIGGLEHMHHLPMDANFNLNPRLLSQTSRGALMMGVTAEFLAQARAISRKAQDEFALTSHRRAATAHDEGQFEREIVPVWGRNEAGERNLISQDQCVRRDTSLDALAALKPAFLPEIGTVTAGNSSPLNDGAAAMLVMSEDRARALGLQPLARVRSTAVAGVDPCIMGTGPVPATQKALKRASLTIADIDLIEINEAFAPQYLACEKELELDRDKVNVDGGAIALGHPLAASGARITAHLVHELRRRQGRYAVGSACIGGGQGIAVVLERA